MKVLLLSIPFFTALFGIALYKFQDGKGREVFKLDFVQFMYLFVLSPTIYVWAKSFLHYILRNEIDIALSATDIFIVDTAFSVVAFFTFAALAMHSLTKTFWLKRHHDPEFDMYHLSEYFHLYWTHIAIWTGIMLLIAFISFINLFVPIQVEHAAAAFYTVLSFGALFGSLLFMSIWGSDPGQGNFMRLMKIVLMCMFILHVGVYYVLEPAFKLQYAAYWFSLFLFLAGSFSSMFFERSARVKKIRNFWLHVGWGENKGIQLFPLKKRT